MVVYGIMRNLAIAKIWVIMALVKSLPAQYLSWCVRRDLERRANGPAKKNKRPYEAL